MENEMGLHTLSCPVCDSSNIRASHLRRSDAGPLFRLLYPVRCMNCHEREFMPILDVLKMVRVRKKRTEATQS
jgi:hypothetical protein